MSPTLHCFATTASLCIYVLLPTTGRYCPSFWQVQVPYSKPEFNLFRVVHWASKTRFHSNIFPQRPVYLLSVSSISPHFLARASPFLLSFLLLVLLSLNPPNLLYVAVSLLGLLQSPSIFSRHFLISARPLLLVLANFRGCHHAIKTAVWVILLDRRAGGIKSSPLAACR